MRFIVFVDLLGTIILPATFVYLVRLPYLPFTCTSSLFFPSQIYLIVTVATGSGSIPTLALILIAAVRSSIFFSSFPI
jgi:chitin synthase